MKTKIIVSALLTIFLFGLQGFGTTTGNKCLDVYVQPVFHKITLEQCTITLYRDNRVEAILQEPNFRNKYSFSLVENEVYTIIIQCEGFHARKISIDTSLPVDIDLSSLFSFTAKVEMIPASVALNPELEDHPIAMVAYDEKADIFSVSEKYTGLVKKGLFDKMRTW